MKNSRLISANSFVADFLRSEWYKHFYDNVRSQFDEIVTNPDVNDAKQNYIRRHLLWRLRFPLLREIPRDIEWQIIDVSNDEFADLKIIRESGWGKVFGPNKTLVQAADMFVSGLPEGHGINFDKVNEIRKSIGSLGFSNKLICIATDPDSPRTIIEGNHRGLAFQIHRIESGASDHLPKEIILGTSKEMHHCTWLNP
ncbi:hypothetical protein [Solemya elarraichensis gill symbiont]|uniref:Uncharacterized protein n=1 Tax=Solemya elarraichensis gill symbiont TaxID=1918949 RepID=A0A1T2KYR1_9GAMM|nr:hypothetical protein [Solemya elarraichensis gill symbiont]OOZ37973.1 hypothetical protein BOW52_09740 [Solemya elarraichensis gill symbiont]